MNQFMALIHVDVILVTEETLTVLLDPAGIHVLSAVLGGLLLPGGVDNALIHLFTLFPAHVLPWVFALPVLP
jgi:hypothetical protein